MSSDLFSLAESRRLKDEGMSVAASTDSASQWLQRARDTAMFLCQRNGETSADEVLRIMPRPYDVPVNSTGSLFRDKRFKKIGYKESCKVSAHARSIGIWVLND